MDMAEGKKTFVFYADWGRMIKALPNEDAGQLIKHILAYVNDENPTTENPLIKLAFAHFEPMLKSDLKKWEIKLARYSKMGKASASKRKSTKAEPTLTKVQPTLTVNDNVNVNVNVNDNDNVIKKEKENGNKLPSTQKSNSLAKSEIQNRKTEFANDLVPLISDSFTKIDARKFFDYWTEHGKNDRKMRFEKEKSFSLKRRIGTWIEKKVEFAPKSDGRITVNEAIGKIERGEIKPEPKYEWNNPKQIKQKR